MKLPYIGRKLLQLVLTLLGVVTFNFLLFRVLPGDPIQLPAQPGPLSFAYYFAHNTTSSASDSFRVFVEAGGARTEVYHEIGTHQLDPSRAPNAIWVHITPFGLDGPLVEAAVDDVRIQQP